MRYGRQKFNDVSNRSTRGKSRSSPGMMSCAKCVNVNMASPLLSFHPEARMEALEAFDWYSQRSQQVAGAFEEELRDAGRAIEHAPELWAPYLSGTRRYLMKRFPFVVIYRVASGRIEIVAIAHGRRKPGYWKWRLGAK
jgi:toxin ParE1/3/4